MYEKESIEIIGLVSGIVTKEYTEKDMKELEKKIQNKLDLIISEKIQDECLECDFNPDHVTEPDFIKEEMD